MIKSYRLPKAAIKAFEQVPDLYLILSPELQILAASDAYLKATYTVREEITGKHLFDVFPDNPMALAANAVQQLRRSLQQVLATRQPHRMPVQRYDVPNKAEPCGFAEKYWLPMNSPVLDEQGQVQYIIHKVEDVTEKILAEKKLAQEFRHLKDAQAIGHIGSFERALSESIITCSNEWYHLHGLEPQSEVITIDRLYSFFHQEDRQEALAAIEHTLTTGEPLHLVHRIVRADGAVRYVQRKGEILKDERGMPYKVYGTVQDITEHVEAQKKVEERERLLRATEEVAHLGSYELDIATTTYRFSDGMYRLLGEAPQSFVPSPAYIDERTHPDDVPVVKAILEQAIQNKAPYQYTRRICRTDGVWRVLEAQGIVECDAAGRAIKLLGLVQDATDRIKAEQELKQSRELLQTTIDSSLDMIQVFEAVRNESGKIIDFKWILNNQTSAKMYGDVLGKSLLELNPGVVEVGIFATFKKVVETGSPDQTERHYVHEQFDGWFYQSTVKLGDGVATTTRDITDRKKAEQELISTKEFLQATLDTTLQVVQSFQAVRNEAGEIIDFVWLYTNRKWKELYGDEMVGKRLLEENPGVIESGLFQKFIEVTETGLPMEQDQHYAYEQFDGWFYQTLAKLGDGFVMTTTDITERKRSQQEILQLKDEIAQRATERYHALFNTIEEGLAICNLVRNDEGIVVDLRYQELNRALEQQMGLDRRSIIGRKLSEVLPKADAERWIPHYSEAANVVKPVTFEEYADILNRWYAVSVYPRGEELSIFYRDITERKRLEKRQTLLLKLNDAIRPLTDPVAIMATVSEIVGRHFKVGRCGYTEVPPPYDQLVVERDWTNGVMQSLQGRHPLSGFSDEMIRQYRTGQTIVVEDAFEDARNEGKEERIKAAGNIRSSIAVQLMKEDNWVATFYVQDSVKRSWTQDEVDLMEEIADRTWAALERARAEDALRRSEEKYRTLFNSMDEGYCIIQMIYDETGKATDFRYLQVNQAFERNTGLHNAKGKTIRELAPDIEPKWMEIYDQVAQTGAPLRFEEASEALHHIFSLYAFRIGAPAEHKVAVIFSDITERKKAEEALCESEERFRNLVESYAQAVWETSATGEVTVDSPSWRAYTGQTLEEWLGFGWVNAIHPDDRDYAELQWREAVAAKSLVDARFRMQHAASGGYRWTNVRATPILDDWGNITKWVGMNIDVHEQKKAEEVLANYNVRLEQEVSERTNALKESNERFQAAINVSPVVLGILRSTRNKKQEIVDFRVEWVSRSGETMVGRDITGLQLGRHFPFLRKARVLQRLINTAENGLPTDHEFQYNSDGFDLWVRWKALKLENGLFISVEDITERKRAELELRESKLLAEQITEATPDFIMIFNLPKNKVEFVNQNPYSGNSERYHETLQIDYEQLMNRSHPEDRPKLHQYINRFRTASDEQAHTLEYRVVDQGKAIWYRTRGKVFRRDKAGKPTHFISVVQDISDLKQLEHENLQMRLAQQRTNLLAILDAQEEERRRISEALHNGVGQVLYTAKLHLSHYLEQQKAKKETADPVYQVDLILDEAISQARGLSHQLAPALLEQFGLETAFKEIGSTLSTPSLHMQCLVYNLPQQLDKHLQIVVYRIAQEMANNIIRHSGATEASLLLRAQRKQLVLIAEDNGRGFEPATSLRNGIGLGSIKNRMELLNGTFSLNSSPGQGTQVKVTLPL